MATTVRDLLNACKALQAVEDGIDALRAEKQGLQARIDTINAQINDLQTQRAPLVANVKTIAGQV